MESEPRPHSVPHSPASSPAIQEPITPLLIAELWSSYYEDASNVHLDVGVAGLLARGLLDAAETLRYYTKLDPVWAPPDLARTTLSRLGELDD